MILRPRLTARLHQAYELPTTPFLDFLVPSLCTRPIAKSFTSSSRRRSRVGCVPLNLPAEVDLRVIEPPSEKFTKAGTRLPGSLRQVEVEGPLGKISFGIAPFIGIEQNPETRKVALSVNDKNARIQKAMWGTTRALLNSHILGVSEGHTAILKLVGVGYRATIESSAITKQPEFPGQQFVALKLGYSHPIEMPVPKDMTASVPQPTRILIIGPVKQLVHQFAAEIRRWRVPEPYKGKGIFVNGETVQMKAKKIK